MANKFKVLFQDPYRLIAGLDLSAPRWQAALQEEEASQRDCGAQHDAANKLQHPGSRSNIHPQGSR